MPGATFKVHRDFQLNDQQFKLIQDSRQAIERVSVITSGFQGKSGTATSGVQEQTQVDQTFQSAPAIAGGRITSHANLCWSTIFSSTSANVTME